jgi:hypothetical protein
MSQQSDSCEFVVGSKRFIGAYYRALLSFCSNWQMPRLLQLLLFLLIQTAHFRRNRFVENLGLQQQFCVLVRISHT